jgi:hypothetical protein
MYHLSMHYFKKLCFKNVKNLRFQIVKKYDVFLKKNTILNNNCVFKNRILKFCILKFVIFKSQIKQIDLVQQKLRKQINF